MIFYQYQTVNFALFCGEKRLKKGFGTAYCAFQAIKKREIKIMYGGGILKKINEIKLFSQKTFIAWNAQ